MSRFELYFPVKPWKLTQGFGGNPDIYKQFDIKGHNGLDAVAYHGQPVYAAHDGDVTYSGMDGKEGVGVVLVSDKKYEYAGGEAYMKTVYWHLVNDVQVRVGQSIKAGTLIGYADNSGFSTGDHLHFALKPVAQGESGWVWENVVQNNGYKGAIDPTPYFNGYYAVDAQKVLGIYRSIIELLSNFLKQK